MFDDYTWSYTNLADGSRDTPGAMCRTGRRQAFHQLPERLASHQGHCAQNERRRTDLYHPLPCRYARRLSGTNQQCGYRQRAERYHRRQGRRHGDAYRTGNGVTADTIYPLRSPDSLRVVSQADPTRQAKHYFYTFRGWRVKATNTVLDPAQPLTAVQLAGYENGGVIELEAVWSVKDANGRATSVNFFIHLFCEIKDFHSNGFTNNPVGDYTKSLFTTTLLGTDALSSSDNLLVLAPPTTDATAYETDDILRTMTDTPYDGLTMEAFPSDREMFALLRENNYTIKIGNSTIPQSKLTSDYFQVRWTNLKYDISDGWHVDGVLVAKEAKLRVTKTFLGSAAAIASVKAQTGEMEYGIRIQNTTTNAEELLLTLNPAGRSRARIAWDMTTTMPPAIPIPGSSAGASTVSMRFPSRTIFCRMCRRPPITAYLTWQNRVTGRTMTLTVSPPRLWSPTRRIPRKTGTARYPSATSMSMPAR